MRHLLILSVLALSGACTAMPPPTEDNNFVACRDLARIERDDDESLTDQFTAQLDSISLGCPRILG